MTSLSRHHRQTYEAVLSHPAPHNLQWRDVRSMLGAVAQTIDGTDGTVRVIRNGHTMVLHPGGRKDFGSPGQLGALRAFLESSEAADAPAKPAGVNLLVVIDHRVARVYRTDQRGTDPVRITPDDPHGEGRHLHHVENDATGQRRPELRSFYDTVAKALQGADTLVLLGGGTGASSAMRHLHEHLIAHHKDLAARVIGVAAVDETHMTEHELLATARGFEAGRSTIATS